MFFEDPVFWKCAYIWKTSEEKVSKNTVRTSMRKTCKIDPKNESKKHQKSSKNTPKKHTEKTTTQFQPKGDRRVTKTRPTREGKGGIQDGILLEKKRILQKPDLLRGKGACGKETRRHSQCQHAPAVGRTRPGGEFFDVFWSPFGALLVNVGPFWLHLGPCWLHVGPFWLHFGSILDAPGWILQEINRIWNRSSQTGFSQRIWSQNEKQI